jgi:hypothetical protein
MVVVEVQEELILQIYLELQDLMVVLVVEDLVIMEVLIILVVLEIALQLNIQIQEVQYRHIFRVVDNLKEMMVQQESLRFKGEEVVVLVQLVELLEVGLLLTMVEMVVLHGQVMPEYHHHMEHLDLHLVDGLLVVEVEGTNSYHQIIMVVLVEEDRELMVSHQLR